MELQVLTANLLHHVLLSPWGNRSCQESAPARAAHGSQPLLCIHLWVWVPSMGCRGISAASPWAAAWAASWAAGQPQLWHQPHFLFLFPWPWGLQGYCLHVFSLLSLAAILQKFFLPLIKYLIPEVLPLSLVGLALPSSGSISELAVIGSVEQRGRFLASSHSSHPWSCPTTKTLPCKPDTPRVPTGSLAWKCAVRMSWSCSMKHA